MEARLQLPKPIECLNFHGNIKLLLEGVSKTFVKGHKLTLHSDIV